MISATLPKSKGYPLKNMLSMYFFYCTPDHYGISLRFFF